MNADCLLGSGWRAGRHQAALAASVVGPVTSFDPGLNLADLKIENIVREIIRFGITNTRTQTALALLSLLFSFSRSGS